MKDFQTELENLPRLKGGLKRYAARTESLGVKNVVAELELSVSLQKVKGVVRIDALFEEWDVNK